jgi:hypothetical protein
MAETNGVKYLKINRLDASGDDCSPKIQIVDNIRINYPDVGSVLYDILTIQQQADYYLIGIIPQPITSSNPGRFGFSLNASRSYDLSDPTKIPTWGGASTFDKYFTNLQSFGGDATDYWTSLNTSSYEFRATPNERLTLRFTCSIINNDTNAGVFQASAWFFNSKFQALDLTNNFFSVSIPGSQTTTISGSIILTGSLANLAIEGNIIRISGRNTGAFGPLTASYARFDITASPISTVSTLLNFSPEIVNFYNTDDNVLFNNATLPKYSTIYQDIDYSTGLVPTNFELLASGNADYAPIQDSNYTATGWSNSRYKGTKIWSTDFNI